MYEHFKNEFLTSIINIVDHETLEEISRSLDGVAVNYNFESKCTDLVVYEWQIPELLKTYLVCKKIEGLSDKTLYNYKLSLVNFFKTINKAPDNITSNDIRLYLYLYQDQKKISNRSLDKIRQHISSFFNWAQDEEYILNNPAKKIPKIKYEEKPRNSLSQLELEYIRMACETPREKAIIEFLYSTGCRVSELSAVKLSDIDFVTKKVHLFGKGNKHRTSYLNAKAEVFLKEYLAERKNNNSEYIFISERSPYGPLKKEAIEKIVKKIAARAKVDKTITPHVFRHTTATTAIKNGMPVESIQKMLGHSKIDTTMIYAHADEEEVKNQHMKTII